MSAFTSFGKQLPPYPTPGNRKDGPMRRSAAIARRTWSTSAPTRSQTLATSFMNEMRVASMALAAYFDSSALAQSITITGAPGARERRVQFSHQLRGPVVLGADDDAVGPHEVLDGRALLEELRVAHDAERVRRLAPDHLAHLLRPSPPAPCSCRR